MKCFLFMLVVYLNAKPFNSLKMVGRRPVSSRILRQDGNPGPPKYNRPIVNHYIHHIPLQTSARERYVEKYENSNVRRYTLDQLLKDLPNLARSGQVYNTRTANKHKYRQTNLDNDEIKIYGVYAPGRHKNKKRRKQARARNIDNFENTNIRTVLTYDNDDSVYGNEYHIANRQGSNLDKSDPIIPYFILPGVHENGRVTDDNSRQNDFKVKAKRLKKNENTGTNANENSVYRNEYHNTNTEGSNLDKSEPILPYFILPGVHENDRVTNDNSNRENRNILNKYQNINTNLGTNHPIKAYVINIPGTHENEGVTNDNDNTNLRRFSKGSLKYLINEQLNQMLWNKVKSSGQRRTDELNLNNMDTENNNNMHKNAAPVYVINVNDGNAKSHVEPKKVTTNDEFDFNDLRSEDDVYVILPESYILNPNNPQDDWKFNEAVNYENNLNPLRLTPIVSDSEENPLRDNKLNVIYKDVKSRKAYVPSYEETKITESKTENKSTELASDNDSCKNVKCTGGYNIADDAWRLNELKDRQEVVAIERYCLPKLYKLHYKRQIVDIFNREVNERLLKKFGIT